MNLSQPDTLSFPQRYRQAKNLLKQTSRASNPNWYTDALAINLQLHVFVGSDSGAISYIRNTESGVWAKGPNISPEMEADPTLLKPILDGIVAEHLADTKNPGIGIILYVADEFSTAELGPEHQNPAEIEELRRLIKENPRSILEDHSISNESHSWRLFPYPGAASGQPFATAIAFTRRHEPLMQEFRNFGYLNNIPIRTRAISAPLCAISALPWLLEQKPENGFVAIYHYPRFTVLSFFNTHGDLILIRTLQHHGNIPFSPQTASAIMTTTASLEIENPHIFIIPMAGATPKGLSHSLSSMLPNSQVITLSPTSSALHIPTAPTAASVSNDLGVTRPWKWSDLTAQTSVESDPSRADLPNSESAIPGVTRPWVIQDMPAVAMLSQVRLEVVSTTNPPSASKSILAESHTFGTLVTEMWPIQDFLPASTLETKLYPDQIEMKLLKWSKWIKVAAACLVVGSLCKLGIDLSKSTAHPAWGYEATHPELQIFSYRKSANEYDTLNNLLSDRARAWSNMELLTRLFPKEKNVILKDFNYKTSIQATNAINNRVPVIRTWTLTGSANSEGRDYLETLNSTAGMVKVFEKTYQGTLDESFDMSIPGRKPRPDIQIKRAHKSRRGSTSTPTHLFDFKMTINQRLDDKDPLTLPLAKKK
ncbi:MAG: hypothetical protein ABGY95_12620 [Rubritalea sp.]|uniref:hypothetical protein n=1 Tax=Rubritalea sp. TaxID=2109375 RepID=UPI003241FB50